MNVKTVYLVYTYSIPIIYSPGNQQTATTGPPRNKKMETVNTYNPYVKNAPSPARPATTADHASNADTQA